MTKKEHIRLNIYLSTNIKTALYYEQSKLGVMEIRGKSLAKLSILLFYSILSRLH